MSNIKYVANYDSFIKEARFFYCQDIYEGDWDGKERFIVASDTPEKELWKKYPIIMKKLSPYMFCNAACGEIYTESKRNIDKFKKRDYVSLSSDLIDVLADGYNTYASDVEKTIFIQEALSICTPIQRERIIEFYLEGMSLDEIARGKSLSTISESIEAGIKKIRIFYGIDPKKGGV